MTPRETLSYKLLLIFHVMKGLRGMDESIAIFSHYGYSSYLQHTLRCARKTNPDARLIFLGDKDNAEIARSCGWEHHLFKGRDDAVHSRFNTVFRHVCGRDHGSFKNGQDWLRFVFERWFYINEFLNENSISSFWHFDSDTMILDDLAPHRRALSEFDYTVQCNGICLNGFIKSVVVSEFCDHICTLFEDRDYISRQQQEFDSTSPTFAFTEMRAFKDYSLRSCRPYRHLLYYRDDLCFDDCICQDHGFQMVRLPLGETVKKVDAREGKFYGQRDGRPVRFVTLNLSWVPEYVFRWVLSGVDGSNSSIEQSAPWGTRLLGLTPYVRTRRLASAVKYSLLTKR